MFTRNKANAPTRKGDGLRCHVLLQEHDVRGDHLAVTWVDVAPGGRQRPHRHVPEQVYIIIKGKGRVQVGDDSEEVGEGDLVYVPSNVVHWIENLSDQPLTYIAAYTPGYDLTAVYEVGEAVERAAPVLV